MERLEHEPDEQAPVNSVKPEEFRFALRAGEAGDVAFIVDSWRRSYEESAFPRCPGGLREYIATQRAVINQALATSEVLVAYPEAPERRTDQILGWACYRRPAIVHAVYVKPYFRQRGIGLALLLAAVVSPEVTYLTHDWRFEGRPAGKLLARYLVDRMRIAHNPALIFGPTKETP